MKITERIKLDAERIKLDAQGLIDEIVISPWFHLENLGTRDWFLSIGDKKWTLHVTGCRVKWIPVDGAT